MSEITMYQKRGYHTTVKRFVLIYIIFVALMVYDSKEVIPMDFNQFRWKHRLLLLFAPNGDDPLLKQIHSELIARKVEVDDRDLVIFHVFEQEPSRMNSTLLNPETVESIRNRFAAPRNRFTLILVGKDGGIKLKRSRRTDLKDIFALIDSMPMRQNEMRRKNNRP